MSKHYRLIVIVAILASFVAFLDSAVVNVALPAIRDQLGGGLATQQWITDAYLLSLCAFILIAGSLSDLFGRLRVLRYGLAGFGIASLICALAPNPEVLIGARALQGIAGALLVPSSLALIADRLKGHEFAKGVGSWTAWTGMAFLIGPPLGGLLVDSVGWRWIFAINVLPIIGTLILMAKLEADVQIKADTKIDWLGAALAAFGLVGPVYALIEQPRLGWSNPIIYLSLIIGVAILALFAWYESRASHPMLPLGIFKHRNFAVGNLATFAIYAGLSAATFSIVLYLQQNAGYTATASGISLLPITLLMFVLSPRTGAWAEKFGPRWFMAFGPIIGALGFTLLAVTANPAASYWTHVLPGVLVFGLGLSLTVSPLTAAILGDVDSGQAGIGSAINNAVSRVAGLLSIAAIGVFAGFQAMMLAMATLLVTGGIISAIGIQNRLKSAKTSS